MTEVLVASDTVSKWIYQTLNGDSALNAYDIYEEPSPAEATFPRIVFSQSSGSHIQGHNAIDIMYSGVWLIKVIDKYTSFSRASNIAKRIHELLHRQSGVLSTGTVLSSRATETIRYAEVTNGINYRHLGFLFEIGAQ